MITHVEYALADIETGEVRLEYGKHKPSSWTWDSEKFVLVKRDVDTIYGEWHPNH